MKIGITERGDAALDLSWSNKIDSVDGAIIISKNPTIEKFRELLLKYKNKIIFHSTITFMGNSELEPNVPDPILAFKGLEYLINSGFPANQIVLRVDPIIYEFQTKLLTEIAPEIIGIGITRIRYSIIDFYPHVKERFSKTNLPIPWLESDQFQVRFLNRVGFMVDMNEIGKKFNLIIETCAENISEEKFTNTKNIGCISNKDIELLGLKANIDSGKSQQRKYCLCLGCKTELLENKQRCAHKCLYCYWRD